MTKLDKSKYENRTSQAEIRSCILQLGKCTYVYAHGKLTLTNLTNHFMTKSHENTLHGRKVVPRIFGAHDER